MRRTLRAGAETLRRTNLFPRQYAQVVHAVCGTPLQQISELKLLLLVQRNDQTAVLLKSKVQIVVHSSKHLIAFPAVFSAVGTGLVIVACMNDAAVPLGSTLGDIVRAVEEQNVQMVFGQLSGNTCADATGANNHNIPNAIGRRLRARGKALAPGKLFFFDSFRRAIRLEKSVAGLYVSPDTSNVTERG